jgi:hypothetical protein
MTTATVSAELEAEQDAALAKVIAVGRREAA